MNLKDTYKDWCEWVEIDKSPRTADDYKGIIKHYLESMEVKDLDDVTPKQLTLWVNKKGNTGLNRRRLVLRVIKSFHRYAHDLGFSSRNPSSVVRVKTDNLTHKQKETKRVDVFTPDEYQQVILHLDKQLMELMAMQNAPSRTRSKRYMMDRMQVNRFWKCAIMLSYETGLRLSDICQLEWDCIGMEELVVHTDKRDKRVAIPIWDEVLEAIMAIPPTDDKVYCFPKQRGQLLDPRKRTALSKAFEYLLKQCDVHHAGLGFHSLRHTCFTRWKSKGMDIDHIQKLAGHSSSETTEGYIHA